MAKENSKRVLFVPGDLGDLVVLNWYGTPQEHLELFAQAFYRAARKIAEGYDDKIVRDIAMCPAIYLYRHAFELYLKAVLLAGEQLRELKGQPTLHLETCINGHRLTDLAGKFLDVANDMGWGDDLGADGLRTRGDFLALVNEWDALDQQSFSFRYPMNKKGGAALPDQFAFGLRHFRERMEPLLDILDGSVTAVEEARDSYEQARAHHSD
jgi:hypothetical protein